MVHLGRTECRRIGVAGITLRSIGNVACRLGLCIDRNVGAGVAVRALAYYSRCIVVHNNRSVEGGEHAIAMAGIAFSDCRNMRCGLSKCGCPVMA